MLCDLLRFLLKKLVDALQNLRGHLGVGRGADRPGLVLPQINVPEQRTGRPALLGYDAGIHLATAVLADFHKLVLIVLAIEDAQGIQQPV